ncbi:hypothetical protein DL765_010403 [Monosporascus sp. GIB2]|nr:hypothetical protein DL765_010403 [Monosporascus sp. GIB2]
MVQRIREPSSVTSESSPPRSTARPAADPLSLTFYRQSARRFIFSNNVPLASLVPGEIVDLDLMHPIVGDASTSCIYALQSGALDISSSSTSTVSQSARYVGGVNPYAVYEVDVQRIDSRSQSAGQSLEVVLDFSTADKQTCLQVAAIYPSAGAAFEVRILKNGLVARRSPLFSGAAPEAPYKLHVQLTGVSLNASYTKNGQTVYLGRVHPDNDFREQLDLRRRKTALGSTFNILTILPPRSRVVLGRVSSYLTAGLGQADIRNITYRDGAPYIEDNRLWFTFTARGIGTGDCSQGVMSLDPSTSDFRFEGTIVFDHGDGLLRNDYASHLFYDEVARVWRAWVCDFGGSANLEGRGPTGLIVAESPRDPRRGFTVMRASVLSNITAGRHEDPCGFYDAGVGKWRLITTAMQNSFRATLFESANWNGPFARVGDPVTHNSTGTLIQKIGNSRYVLAGSDEGAIFVYSYPGLLELGKLKMDLPPFTPGRNSRVWPNIFPLPAGYPARYMAVMMDRANFPGVTGDTWSYGALYIYWAFTDDISSTDYEFAPR